MKKAEGGEAPEKVKAPRARTKTAATGKGSGAAKKAEAAEKAAKTPAAKAAAAKAPVKTRAAAPAKAAEARAAKKIAAKPAAAKAAPSRAAAKPSGKRKGLAAADLARIVASAAAEHKLINPVLLDLSGLSSVADWFFIATAENARQMGAIADKIIRRVREHGLRPLGREGQMSAQWALVDLGDVIVHLFSPEARELYDLEGLWADAAILKV